MIHILSDFSYKGGSTISHINLTNAFNEAGYRCCFYGAHNYPEFKCKFKMSNHLKLNKDDNLIVHLKDFDKRPDVKKFILTVHEQDFRPVSSMNYKIFDKIRYVSEHQRLFHNVDHPYFILGNIIDNIKPGNVRGVAGIIGTVNENKRTDVSIKRALADGFKRILIFGLATSHYWDTNVKPLVDGKIVKYKGYCEDRQKMYNMISDVYISSDNESCPRVLGESRKAGKIIHGIEGKNYLNINYEFDKNVIINTWLKEL